MKKVMKETEGKRRWSLLPWVCIRAVVDVMEFGAAKYAPNAWKSVEDAETLFWDASMRHRDKRLYGEIYDTGPGGSGLPHRAHIATNELFLLWFDLTRGE